MIKTLGKMAIYKGEMYEFLQKSDGTYAIYSSNTQELVNGFKKIDEKRYMKLVSLEELDYVYEKNTIVIYQGDEFIGSSIEGSAIMLYTRNVLLGKKYNMTIRDKDEYYMYVNLCEVDEVIQKWKTIILGQK